MARISFPLPSTTENPTSFPIHSHEGVLYEYSGIFPNGFWKANSQNVVEDTYVNTTGDTIASGDLTISTLSGLGPAVLGVDANGKLFRANANSELESPFLTNDNNNIVGDLNLETNLSVTTVSLEGQTGDATFRGNLLVGNVDFASPAPNEVGGGLRNGMLFAKRNDAGNIYEGYDSQGNLTSSINGSGSGVFGNITLAGVSSSDAITVSRSNYSDQLYVGKKLLETTYEVLTDGTIIIGGNTPSVEINATGSAEFSGNGVFGTEVVVGVKDNQGVSISANGDLNSYTAGIEKYSINADGTASFVDINVSDILATTCVVDNITAQSLTLSSNLTSTGAGSFTNGAFSGSISVGTSITAASANISGALNASNYGAVAGSTASFTGALSSASATIAGDIQAASAVFSGSLNSDSISIIGNATIAGDSAFGPVTCNGITCSNTVEITGQNNLDKVIAGKQGSTITSEINANGSAMFASNNLSIYSNGDVENTNNVYQALSDQKLKTNISTAKSQWNDIKNIRLVNYQFKPSLGYGTSQQLGVISQEVKQISPGLVTSINDVQETVTPEFDEMGMPVLDEFGNQKMIKTIQNTGTKTERVKYSILYLKAVGALQEAMLRIESLEDEVKSLKESLD